jgi:hypothetical protein
VPSIFLSNSSASGHPFLLSADGQAALALWSAAPTGVTRAGAPSLDVGLGPDISLQERAPFVRGCGGAWESVGDGDSLTGSLSVADARFNPSYSPVSASPRQVFSAAPGELLQAESIECFLQLLQSRPGCTRTFVEPGILNLGVQALCSSFVGTGKLTVLDLEMMAGKGEFDEAIFLWLVEREVTKQSAPLFVSAAVQMHHGFVFLINLGKMSSCPCSRANLRKVGAELPRSTGAHWAALDLSSAQDLSVATSLESWSFMDSGAGSSAFKPLIKMLYVVAAQAIVRIFGRRFVPRLWQGGASVSLPAVVLSSKVCPQQSDETSCGLYAIAFCILSSRGVQPEHFSPYFGDEFEASIGRCLLFLLAGRDGCLSIEAAHHPSSSRKCASSSVSTFTSTRVPLSRAALALIHLCASCSGTQPRLQHVSPLALSVQCTPRPCILDLNCRSPRQVPKLRAEKHAREWTEAATALEEQGELLGGLLAVVDNPVVEGKKQHLSLVPGKGVRALGWIRSGKLVAVMKGQLVSDLQLAHRRTGSSAIGLDQVRGWRVEHRVEGSGFMVQGSGELTVDGWVLGIHGLTLCVDGQLRVEGLWNAVEGRGLTDER